RVTFVKGGDGSAPRFGLAAEFVTFFRQFDRPTDSERPAHKPERSTARNRDWETDKNPGVRQSPDSCGIRRPGGDRRPQGRSSVFEGWNVSDYNTGVPGPRTVFARNMRTRPDDERGGGD